jgi:orotidine-5'-phosphate decarboxylase
VQTEKRSGEIPTMPYTPDIMVALDVNTLDEARQLVRRCGDAVTWYKVGKQLFTRFGPESVTGLKQAGKKVFLDLKFHDIPNTVGQAVRSAAAIGADLTNVHAGGGPAMLKEAAAAGRDTGIQVIAVTVLTSLDAAQLQAVGVADAPEKQVLRLARLTADAGLNGVVCSALEIAAMRREFGPEFLLVVPGIRPAGSDVGDQKRVMTPKDAAKAGASFLVIGRPITHAADPAAAAQAILADIRSQP